MLLYFSLLCQGFASFAVAADHGTSAALKPSTSNPFDPSGFIDKQEEHKSEKAGQLSSQAIYRIQGLRYLRLDAPEGTVYLPSPREMPELMAEFAICPQQVGQMGEVLPVREKLPVDARLVPHTREIIGMIRRCLETTPPGPVVVDKTPDGAVIEKTPRKRAGETYGKPNAADRAP